MWCRTLCDLTEHECDISKRIPSGLTRWHRCDDDDDGGGWGGWGSVRAHCELRATDIEWTNQLVAWSLDDLDCRDCSLESSYKHEDFKGKIQEQYRLNQAGRSRILNYESSVFNYIEKY